jgi:hypothetical protein
LFHHLRDVEVTEFCDARDEEDVCAFYVTVDYVVVVEGFETLEQLEGHLPNEGLLESFAVVVGEAIVYFSLQIPAVSILHHDA